MARNHARVQVVIWRDADFRALSGSAQRMYLLLISQADISYCGVLAYRPQRWSTLSATSTVEAVEKAVLELEAARFVLLDRATEELGVRTFARNDGVLDNANTKKAFWRTLQDVVSETIRDGLVEGLPEPLREPVAHGSANPSRNPSANPSRKVRGKGEGGSTGTSSSGVKVVGATAPPDILEITEAMRAFAVKSAPGVDLERETQRMLDWHRGNGKRKKDWVATWRNWMTSEYQKPVAVGTYIDDPAAWPR